jgi:hypothetical protein
MVIVNFDNTDYHLIIKRKIGKNLGRQRNVFKTPYCNYITIVLYYKI